MCLLAVVCWLVSLVVVAIAATLALHGGPVGIFLFLFSWLLSLGLPTSLAVVLVMSFWRGGSFEIFLVVVASLALVLYLVCLWLLRKVIMTWWETRA